MQTLEIVTITHDTEEKVPCPNCATPVSAEYVRDIRSYVCACGECGTHSAYRYESERDALRDFPNYHRRGK